MHREEKGHRPEERFSLFFRYPLGSHWRCLRCAFHCQAAHGGYDVLGRCMLLAGAVFGLFFPRLSRGGAVPRLQWSCRVAVFKRELEGGALSGTLENTDGGGRSAALPSGDAREGSDTPGRREPKECERGRAEVLGTFFARAHRECKVQCGVCDCGRHALRVGRQLASAYRDVSQRPTHKKDTTRDSCCTLHLHHILCSAHTYTRATARRDSPRLSPHSTARASTERDESHDTALPQLSLSKHVHFLPDLPPWCANCVVAS